jgi:CHAT domain-containing protein
VDTVRWFATKRVLENRAKSVCACATILGAVTVTLGPHCYAASQSVSVLALGHTIERRLAGGESHAYEIALRAGACALVAVQQDGIDVSIRVEDAAGATIATFDSEARRSGQEDVEIVSKTAATYRLEVSARYPRDPTGSYEIRLNEVRDATERDRALDQAHRLESDMDALRVAGNFSAATTGLRNAVQLAEQALDAEHPYVAWLLTRLASTLRSEGAYDEAERAYRRALAICDSTVGREHPQTALIVGFWATLLVARDDYATAEPMLQEAIGILERTLGAEHPRVAATLADLADLHSYRHDLRRARAEMERAYAIGERRLETTDFARMALANNLGGLYLTLKEYDRAETLLLAALNGIERRFGVDNVRVSNPLLSLGVIAREKAQYTRALEYLERAYAVRARALGTEHRDTASILITMGNVQNARGEYALALDAYDRARQVLQTTVGPYHNLTVLTLLGSARSYAAEGDVPHAIEYQRRVDEALEKVIDFNLAIGSTQAKLAFTADIFERTSRTISLSVAAPDATDLAALVLLQRKGRVLDAMSSSLTALRGRLNDGDRRLLDELNTTASEVATLALQGPGTMPVPEYQQRLTALEEKRGSLEAEVSRRSMEFRAQSRPVTLAGVQALIPPDAALLEFAVYQRFDPKAPTDAQAHGELRYVACVILREGRIHLQDLGTAADIERLVERLREALRDPSTDPKPAARALDEMVMTPLREWLTPATRLLVSPDGQLNLVPFEALVDREQRYLVERYAIGYLTTGRDLLRLEVVRPSRTGPLIVANALFGEPEQPASTSPRTRGTKANGRRSVVTANSLADVYFAPLAGSDVEAKAIKALFPEAKMLTGSVATKAALAQADAPRVLHIATHGFFLSASDAVDNPLIRSGLALSGANSRRSDKDSGILTALEASNLNLWGTKLVTLSACDTGVGDIENGEGVFGLRRAVFLAGAETLVMSLWPVSDYVTREMMTAYYRNLKQGRGRGDSLRDAQLAMISRPRRQHPFYWASFIQAGEWANLDGRR